MAQEHANAFRGWAGNFGQGSYPSQFDFWMYAQDELGKKAAENFYELEMNWTGWREQRIPKS